MGSRRESARECLSHQTCNPIKRNVPREARLGEGGVYPLGLLVLMTLLCGRAEAMIVPDVWPSLEWLVESAELVVRGTVRPGMQRDVVVRGELRREVTLEVGETIKGLKLEQVTFLMWR